MSSGGFTEHFLVASRAPEALSLGQSTLYVPKCCNEASILYLALALRECGGTTRGGSDADAELWW